MEVLTHNPTSMAWIGDAVMSLYVREKLLEKGYRKADVLQKKSAGIVSARFQSSLLRTLTKEDFFTDDEKEILLRGRNANTNSKAKNATGSQYQEATALECLIGYFYLYHHKSRLDELLKRIGELGELE